MSGRIVANRHVNILKWSETFSFYVTRQGSLNFGGDNAIPPVY